jgi:Tripartite tricarboxylate transporter TctB family
VTAAPSPGRSRGPDVAFALFCLGVAGVSWWEARGLPPGKFDPLGSGAVPIFLCSVMAALGSLILLRVALGLAVGHARQSLLVGVHADGDDPADRRPGRAVATVALTVAYVLAMHRGWLSFLPATSGFLVFLGAVLVERTARAQALSLVVGLTTAVFLDVVFRRILILDLP